LLTVALFAWQQMGNRVAWRVWLWHIPAATAVGLWVTAVCEIPLWQYVALYVYPGLALTLLRSFAEHRPAAEQDHRTAIVEGDPLTRLLFLNLNFHAVHHADPGLPWYALPGVYAWDKAAILAGNGGYRIEGYGRLLRENLITPRDHPVHPDERAAAVWR
jgi:fatty acid desaturase